MSTGEEDKTSGGGHPEANNGADDTSAKRKASDGDSGEPASKKPADAAKSLPTRQYLDETVVPVLLDALAALAKDRPAEPIDFLVAYLQRHQEQQKAAKAKEAS